MLRTRPILTLLALFVTALSVAPGCENEQARLDIIASGVAANGRVATTGNLRGEFDRGKITFESAMIRAEEMLHADDPDALAFAGAVLDLAAQIEDQFPKGAEFELFWRRLGRLAYTAAHAAFEAQDYETAGTLVLAGPERWKRDTYWIAYPNHEILVALSMAYRGDARGGISLLDRRTPQPDEYRSAIESLVQIEREQLRARLRDGIDEGG